MAKIVVVTSGKGGVGKTTTSASFATGLALKGFKTAVIGAQLELVRLAGAPVPETPPALAGRMRHHGVRPAI